MPLGASRPTEVGGRGDSWPPTPPPPPPTSFSKTIQRPAQNAPFLNVLLKYPLYRTLLHQFKIPSVSLACFLLAKLRGYGIANS